MLYAVPDNHIEVRQVERSRARRESIWFAAMMTGVLTITTTIMAGLGLTMFHATAGHATAALAALVVTIVWGVASFKSWTWVLDRVTTWCLR